MASEMVMLPLQHIAEHPQIKCSYYIASLEVSALKSSGGHNG